MEAVLYIAAVCALLGAVGVGVLTWRERRLAVQAHGDLEWVRRRLERARLQMVSEDKDEVLTGLQAMVALVDPDASKSGIRRLSELTESDDRRVADLARRAYKNVTEGGVSTG